MDFKNGGLCFENWLSDKLNDLSLDHVVYFDYIKGILEECADRKEKVESITEVLSGVLEDDIETNSECIVTAWDKQQPVEVAERMDGNPEDHIKILIGQQQQISVNKNSKAVVDRDYRDKLLEQYGQLSDNDSDEGGYVETKKYTPSSFVNTNAKDVMDKQTAERTKQKKASEEKKIKDKENREKQKEKKVDRAEKEKKRTQKGERRAR